MGLSDKEKEHLIALYLTQELFKHFEEYTSEKQNILSRTTPYPEMAHDLLLLVRRLENG